ncbi:RNA polymerase sigma factor [Aquibacillus koreensis]|uniref:RNA polymerase sigma factor n=1 Tax=Aquibacillus koreensis TaxID=279446 RepID=A0A9X3WHC4_9BACI|nr:RNA polymerase sigma factor [Aquibacillus koreensis]MCT2537080.1 RNA polymerase sigma factor [Aquibacillus koreensis]MDC3419937.1 RNA polymerase sigma factor [Aquibacillus koreensis]
MEKQINNDALNTELNIVYRYLIKKGVPRADAEDAVQETAYKYLRYSDSIRSSKVRSWIIRVALNHYYDQCRKNKKYILNIEEKIIEAQQDHELPDLIVLAKERKEEFSKLLSKLKPLYAELLLLKYESELSYAEISQLLGMGNSAVKTNLYRARKKLLKLYEEAQQDER